MSYRQVEPPVQRELASADSEYRQYERDVRRFRAAYVLERRIAERARYGSSHTYHPSASLSGKPKYHSMERAVPKDQWSLTYNKLRKVQHIVPWQYVRLLFSAIRYTDAPMPQVSQLASQDNLDTVLTHLAMAELTLRVQYASEYQRTHSKVNFLMRGGSGHSFAKAVYYALVDRNLGLSSVFRHAFATAAVAAIRVQAADDPAQLRVADTLDKISKETEYYAALDYAVFPDLYDRIFASYIPDRLRLVAPSILAAALGE